MAAVYAVVAWLLVQIIVSIKEPLGLPIWTDSTPFFDSVRAERRVRKLLANVVREPS